MIYEQMTFFAPAMDEEDLIDFVLARGGVVSNSKMRIYDFFIKNDDTKAQAEMLKKEHGTSGRTDERNGIRLLVSYDGKGIEIVLLDENKTILLPWEKAAKRISRLIIHGEYMNFQKPLFPLKGEQNGNIY